MSSSNDPVQKQSSISSKPQNATFHSNPSLSKTISERKNMAHWIESEKEEFKKQLQVHGKNWKKIATIITNKTEKQIRNFYQNYKKKMSLEELLPKNERGRGKKQEPSVSGIKRTRSFTKSASPDKKKSTKRRKVASSDESSEKSHSKIEEEKYARDSNYKQNDGSEDEEDSSLSEASEKPKRRNRKIVNSSSEEAQSSSSSSSDNSVESSLSSKSSSSRKNNGKGKTKAKAGIINKKKSHDYESGESLD